jgi:hypothetical protein
MNKTRIPKDMAVLLILGVALAGLYLWVISEYSLYNIPHYEYYTRALLLYKSLIAGDWGNFYMFIENHIGNEITNFRSLPFMLLFGPTQIIYKFSAFILNYALFILLYLSFKKIYSSRKSMFLTLAFIFSYFTIELFAAPYTDLTFFLACTLYFIHLKAFAEDPRKSNLALALIIFLMLFTRSLSYVVLPVFSLFMLGYFATKADRWKLLARYTLISLSGFLLFFGIVYGFSVSSLTREMTLPTMLMFNTERGTDFSAMGVGVILDVQSKGISDNRLFLRKFYTPENSQLAAVILSLMYISQFYLILKNERFWLFLFIISEICLLVIYNLLSIGYDIRFMLPFYFLYLYPAYAMVHDTIVKLPAKFRPDYAFIALLAVSSLLVFFSRLPDRQVYNHNDAYYTEFIHEKIFQNLPIGSKVYIEEDLHPGKATYAGIIKLTPAEHLALYSMHDADPRYRVNITEDIFSADYIICSLCSGYESHTLSESHDIGIPIKMFKRSSVE